MMVNGSLSEATWSEKMKGLDDVRGHFSNQIFYDMDSSSLRACKAAIKVEQRVRFFISSLKSYTFDCLT